MPAPLIIVRYTPSEKVVVRVATKTVGVNDRTDTMPMGYGKTVITGRGNT